VEPREVTAGRFRCKVPVGIDAFEEFMVAAIAGLVG
jgi:hypothetical protein